MSDAPLTTQLPASARLDFLDGLRGLAALGVVLHHFTAAFYPSTLSGSLATAHWPGTWEADFAASPLPVLLNMRVCFFFVLSGLVLAASAGGLPRGGRVLAGQLVRRYLRLGVPVAASTALAFGLLLLGAYYNQPVSALRQARWFAAYWQQAPDAGPFLAEALGGVMLRGEATYNPVLWTMAIEWKGSVLVLGLVALLGRQRWRLPAYAVLMLGCFALGQSTVFYGAFLLGLCLHEAHSRWAARLPDATRRALVLGLLLTAGLAYAAMRRRGFNPIVLDRTVLVYHTLSAGLLLTAVLLSHRLRRLAGRPVLRQVGKRAFSLYLTHFLWLGSGASALFLALRPHCSYNASFGLVLLATLLLLTPITTAFYRWVDLPSHALARWLGRRVRGREAAAAPGLPMG